MIDVIVPVYKVEKYLKRCVDSILSQTLTDYQLWLVDDGSPDACGRICDEYAKTDSRIHVIHKPNGGLSDARNKALDLTEGQYICFVDSDDWIPQDSLETMLDAIKRTGADMAVGNMIAVYDDGHRKDEYCPFLSETVLEGDRIFDAIVKPCAPNRLYNAHIFQNLRYPVGRLFEDVFTIHHVLEQVKKIVFTGKENYYYFLRRDSIMRTAYISRNMDIIDAIADQADTLLRLGQHDLAMKSMLFVYSQLSAAYAYLDKNDRDGKARRQREKRIYSSYYPALMRYGKTNWKQKIRLTVLRYAPHLHTILWGRKMPYNLA